MCRNGQEMGSHELSFERSVGTLTVKMGHCCVSSWSGDPSEVAVVMVGYLLCSNFIASLSMRISAAFKTSFWVFQQVSFSLIVLYLICRSVNTFRPIFELLCCMIDFREGKRGFLKRVCWWLGSKAASSRTFNSCLDLLYFGRGYCYGNSEGTIKEK